jgi:hypothetical protein
MKRTTSFLVAAAIAAPIVLLLGYFGGRATADDSVTRLQLLWPDVLTMPEDDRLALAKIAMACRLNQVEVKRPAIVACMRAGAAELDQRDAPHGSWDGQLTRLLRTAKGGA